MATWSELTKTSPEIAAVGQTLLDKHGLAYLATVRADGSPRVHPVCPFIADGSLFVTTAPTSPKRFDLLRDGRYVLHMLPGKNDDEFWVRGRASLVTDAARRSIAAAGARDAVQPGTNNGIELKDDEWLFEYDITSAASAYWVNVGQPGTYPVRQSWRSSAPAPNERMKIVWRFNLRDGVDPAAFFAWLRENVWASSATYGCTTRAFALKNAAHAYSTEATWPDAAARDRWQASDDFRAIPNYPGHDSPWAAQVDLEPVLYSEITP